jgi:hypothetical protein|tara:strand:+ start:137 stop:307 length:171 start_codon:yes stop_codon:yes gene_type:complete
MTDFCEQENCEAPLENMAMLIGHMDEKGITQTTKMICLACYDEIVKEWPSMIEGGE